MRFCGDGGGKGRASRPVGSGVANPLRGRGRHGRAGTSVGRRRGVGCPEAELVEPGVKPLDHQRIRLTVQVPAEGLPSSPRLVEVGLRFGVPMAVPGKQIASDMELSFKPGSITLITGPSGSGKSMMLAEISKQFPASRLVDNVPFPLDVTILDAVAPARPIHEALRLLTATGLGEPMLWIRRFHQLSEGERFRARLARVIWLNQRDGKAGPLLCDEFGTFLHRRLAKAVALNLRKLIGRERLTLVVATSHDDLERDLYPDQIVRLGGSSPVIEVRSKDSVRYRSLQGGSANTRQYSLSFARRLRIERGSVRDYDTFADMHYRQRNQLGWVDKVFLLREGIGGELLGIVVYGYPALELAPRNRATCKRFVGQPKLLNEEVRVLKRLVIHPDVRGCGLGHWLVRRTLPMVGTSFVECLASMGVVNPVFEKAGMRQVSICEPPASLKKTLSELRSTGADPLQADFVAQVCRRPSVRRLVKAAVGQWYNGLSSVGQERVAGQTPAALAQTFRQMAGSQPVYYIWARNKKGWSLIERGLGSDEK